MKIAVMSDTHDHLENIEAAIHEISMHAPDMLLHCGDLCAPFVIDRLAAFNGPVHIVFGNNDGDRFTIAKIARRSPNVTIHGEFGFITTGDGEIAFTHRPEFAHGLASTGAYTAVFHGHTHRHRRERVAGTWLVNPGEIMGLLESPGWILFDLATGGEERFSVTR
jgi:putative phosphoesterase